MKTLFSYSALLLLIVVLSFYGMPAPKSEVEPPDIKNN